MSRRKNRAKFTSTKTGDNKNLVSSQTAFVANSNNILVDNKDVLNSLITGAVCLALLVALSEIIHKTNWLTPLIDRFNSLI